MKKPDAEIEKQFNAGGIFFSDEVKLADVDKYARVSIEILAPTMEQTPEFGLAIDNQRGVRVMVTDWEFVQRSGQKVLKFFVSIRIPSVVSCRFDIDYLYEPLAMSFLDLCYYTGGGALEEDHVVDVATPVREDAVMTHLGWILPSHFVDCAIDALGKLNTTMFEGSLEECMVYFEGASK